MARGVLVGEKEMNIQVPDAERVPNEEREADLNKVSQFCDSNEPVL